MVAEAQSKLKETTMNQALNYSSHGDILDTCEVYLGLVLYYGLLNNWVFGLFNFFKADLRRNLRLRYGRIRSTPTTKDNQKRAEEERDKLLTSVS